MSACGSGITQEQYDQLESEKKAVEDEKKKVDGELEQTKKEKPGSKRKKPPRKQRKKRKRRVLPKRRRLHGKQKKPKDMKQALPMKNWQELRMIIKERKSNSAEKYCRS